MNQSLNEDITMKISILTMLCLIGLLTAGGAAWSEDANASGDAEKAVAAAEQRWLEAQRANNPDLLAPLLADTITYAVPSGSVRSKTEILASEKATRYDSAVYEDFKVRGFGDDAAVATGIVKVKGTDETGKPMDVSQRFTDTWIKMPNGQWQCVASHASNIPK